MKANEHLLGKSLWNGTLAITRLLFPSRCIAPDTVFFPVVPPTPRPWESVIPALLFFGVISAGLKVLIPSLTAGWAIAFSTVVGLFAVLACGGLARATGGKLASRWSLGIVLAVCAILAMAENAWPRPVALLSVAFVLLNVLASWVERLPGTVRVSVVLLALHGMALLAFWLGGWHMVAWSLLLIGLVMVMSTFNPHGGLFMHVIRRIATDERTVCLTIDDGPCDDTDEILDVLAEFESKALFFVIGNRVEKQPEALRRMLAEGHGIGNHTQSHPVFGFWGYTPARMRREMTECQEQIAKACGVDAQYFRAPVGFRNPYCPAVAHELEMQIMGWQARGLDGIESDPEKVSERIRRSLCPGAIILLHQGMPRSPEILHAVLEMLRDEGWKVTLPKAWSAAEKPPANY